MSVELTKLETKKLALGEATGHHHSAVAESAELWGVRDDLPSVLKAPNGTEITHQEHGPITVPPGDYDIRIVNEFDHFREAARKVVD